MRPQIEVYETFSPAYAEAIVGIGDEHSTLLDIAIGVDILDEYTEIILTMNDENISLVGDLTESSSFYIEVLTKEIKNAIKGDFPKGLITYIVKMIKNLEFKSLTKQLCFDFLVEEYNIINNYKLKL